MRTLLLAVVLTVVSAPVRADEASHRAKAESLLELLNTSQMLDSAKAMIDKNSRQAFERVGGRPEDQAIFDEFSAKLGEAFEQIYTWDRLKPSMIDIYVDMYTEAEMDQVIAFYRTPVGQKTIEKMPLVMERSMELTQEMLQELLPKITELTQEMAKEVHEARREAGPH